MMVNLLQRGYDYLMDEKVDHDLIVFENLEDECGRVFGDDFDLGVSNQTDEDEDEVLVNDQEMDMIRLLNPYEWDFYGF